MCRLQLEVAEVEATADVQAAALACRGQDSGCSASAPGSRWPARYLPSMASGSEPAPCSFSMARPLPSTASAGFGLGFQAALEV